jgi:hypothetical protein
MRRLIVSSSVLAVVAACARSRGPSAATSTTTITGGTPMGVRVTNVEESQPDPGLALADELCRREAACNHIGAAGGRYRTEEACAADLGARLPAQIASWNCSPAAERARFEECLAAIRSERCDTDLVSGTDRLPLCRATAVCPPPAVEK